MPPKVLTVAGTRRPRRTDLPTPAHELPTPVNTAGRSTRAMTAETFGEHLRRLRQERKLSLRQLSASSFIDFSQLSKVENGHRRPSAILAVAVDQALHAGGTLVALAESERGQLSRGLISYAGSQGPRLEPGRADAHALIAPSVTLHEMISAEPSDYGTLTTGLDTDVNRREALTLGGLAASRLVIRLSQVARALTPYGLDLPDAAQPHTIAELAMATAEAKKSYQACRYGAALDQIVTLLAAVRATRSVETGDGMLAVEAVAAAAYQVTGSVLLKLGDIGLAALAADRSMDAALRSTLPLPIAASARLVTHALMNAGHTDRATEIATTAAQRLNNDLKSPSPEALSIYGALILRAAIAAARSEDRASAHHLLDEAEATARRLGIDGNAEWTAFGPTNVKLHRVNVAVLLGDAGTAIELAQHIGPSRVLIAERRASLLIDVAQAYAQWGKFDRSYAALAQAEQTAPEEVHARTSVHRLIADLVQRGPRTVGADAHALANRIGIDV
jgi:transcriptional regulator with XRE-family HTH domain